MTRCGSGLICQCFGEIVSVHLQGRKHSLSKKFSKSAHHYVMSGTKSYDRSLKKNTVEVRRLQLSLNESERQFPVFHNNLMNGHIVENNIITFPVSCELYTLFKSPPCQYSKFSFK